MKQFPNFVGIVIIFSPYFLIVLWLFLLFSSCRCIVFSLTCLPRCHHSNPLSISQVIFDLHLPGMACLTGKRSSQNLMLRVLKVIIQLREASKKSQVRGPSQQRTGLSRG